jgi:hypothetical protein
MEREVIKGFLNQEGQLKTWPAKHMKQQLVLQYLAEKFQPEITYTEKEVNELLMKWSIYEDYVLLRRGLVDYGYLQRADNGSTYKRPLPLS